VAVVVLALLGLLAGADWLWVLGTGARAAGLLAVALFAVVWLVRGLTGPARRFARQDAAAEVEAAFPQLGQRVRTTLEYSEPTPATPAAAPELVHALASDAEQRTSPLDFATLIPWRSLWGLGAAVAGLLALFALLLITKPELQTTALRLLLVPVHYTRLEVKPGDHTVKVGDDLDVQVTLTGRPVSSAELHYRPRGGEDWTTLSLAPPDLPDGRPAQLLGDLGATLKDCRDDLEYRVVAGPVESPVYRLTVLHPLVLKKIEATAQPPAYTRRPAATVREGDFAVIAGSAVRFRITLDREPQSARLVLYPAGPAKPAVDVPPVALRIQGSKLSGELAAVERELEYEVAAEAADGMRLEPRRFRIRVQPDRKPTVRLVKPREQIEVTPTTEVEMKVEAGDDFGLSKVGIVYQIGSGPKRTLDLKANPGQPVSLKTAATLALEEHKVGFQDGVTYYAFAEDNHPTRPQRTTTELQFIDIRPYKRSYQLLKTGGS
jgi:hypothetical protein